MSNHLELLAWYLEFGADEAIGEHPIDRTAALAPVRPAPKPAATLAPIASAMPKPAPAVAAAPSIATGIEAARAAAAAADSLEALAAAVADFDLCPLKRTATKTVFADGNPEAGLMFIGEAPGADEDRIGRPFVGRAGQLLDKMMAAIGYDRQSAYITNVLFWRPPGNRTPTPTEIELCKPFVHRHIALIRPRVLVLLGGAASGALVPGSQGITRLRGRWLNLEVPGHPDTLQAIAMYHPAFLLRTPERKREAWIDLLSVKSKLTTAPK